MFVACRCAKDSPENDPSLDSGSNEDVSNSLWMSQFVLNEIIDPIFEELRKGHETFSSIDEVEVPDEASIAFKLDSDINFMKLLKRPEIVSCYKCILAINASIARTSKFRNMLVGI